MPIGSVWGADSWADDSWGEGTWGSAEAALGMPLVICFTDVAVASPVMTGVLVQSPLITDVTVEVC